MDAIVSLRNLARPLLDLARAEVELAALIAEDADGELVWDRAANAAWARRRRELDVAQRAALAALIDALAGDTVP